MRSSVFVPLLIILASCSEAKVDYRSVVKTLDSIEQRCLDKGEAMMLCTRTYNEQMDSLLNVVYKDLIGRLNDHDAIALKNEERKWLAEKENFTKELYAPINKLRDLEAWVPQDDRMIVYGKEAEFTKDRLLILIEKYEAL